MFYMYDVIFSLGVSDHSMNLLTHMLGLALVVNNDMSNVPTFTLLYVLLRSQQKQPLYITDDRGIDL